jgi:YD repeat-containing protein
VTGYYGYDIAGNVTKFAGPNVSTESGNVRPVTQVFYDDAYAYESGSPPGPTYAIPTRVVDPKLHESSARYQYWLGALGQVTDPNAQSTSYTYNDSLDRVTRIDRPVGYTRMDYSPTAHTISGYESLDVRLGIQREVFQVTTVDGFGRPIRRERQEQSGTARVDTQYDPLDRVWKVSQPSFGTPSTGGR